MDFKSVTVGQIADQYTHPVSYLESGAYRSWKQTKEFVWQKIRNKFAGWQAKSAASSNIPGWSEPAMKEEVAAVYLRVQQAQAQMQPDLARDVVSKDVFIKLRAQTEQRRRQGWTSIHWELLDQEQLERNVKVVQRRMVKFFEESRYDYLQYTACISSKQRFAAYGGSSLLAGDPQKVLDVTEYCVFERKTQTRVKRQRGASLTGVALNQQAPVEGSRWRLVGWLQP